MTVMSDDEKIVIGNDNQKFILLNGQMKSDGQTTKTITEMEDKNSILMKNEKVVSLGNLTCDKEEDSEDCTKIFSDEMTDLWHDLSILEKRLEKQRISVQVVNSELNENEKFHYYELEQRDIPKRDDVEERPADSLENYLKNWNQRTYVLIKEKMSEQQIEMLPKEEETQRSYDFDDCFMIAGTDEKTKECLVQENKLK